MSSIIGRALNLINDNLKDQMSSFPDPIAVKPMAQGGHVLEDDYPTHYLPHVGRQVMADGGKPRGYEGRVMAPTPAPVEDPPVIPPEDEGMTACHGSPHGFDEFDTSKIGTGEGAQAYGHGLYFAENEDVAKGYRQNLSPDNEIAADGRKFSDMPRHERDVHNYLFRTGKSPSDAVEHFRKEGEKESEMMRELGMDSDGPSTYSKHVEFAKKLKDRPKFTSEPGGHMYEVRLNVGPEHLLDWEKEFKDQHKDIKNALKESGIYKSYRDNLSDFSSPMQTRNKKMRGENIHEFLSHQLGGQEAASKRLSDLGIRGIKYFDTGSRDKKRGSKNYVIFDPKHIRTVRRYAEGGGIKAYFMHAPEEMGEQILKAHGGAITPIELSGGNLEDQARRLILWSYAVAPLVRPQAPHRADGGPAYPVAMPTEIKEDLEAGNAKKRELSPQEFLDESDPLHIGKGDRHIIRSFEDHIKGGDHLGPLKLYEGGHQDGRHRANAAKNLGVKKVPVIDYRKASGGSIDPTQDAIDTASKLRPSNPSSGKPPIVKSAFKVLSKLPRSSGKRGRP